MIRPAALPVMETVKHAMDLTLIIVPAAQMDMSCWSTDPLRLVKIAVLPLLGFEIPIAHARTALRPVRAVLVGSIINAWTA